MKITLSKYKGNTVYSLYVDKYGEKHHLGFINAKELDELLPKNIEQKYEEIKKPCPEAQKLAECIGAMIKADRTYFTDDRGNHRDGLD